MPRWCLSVTVLLFPLSALPALAENGGVENQVDFTRDVYPLLISRCADCHGPDKQEGQLRIDARAAVFSGGVSGPSVVKGKADESILYQRIADIGDEARMPPGDDPLADAEVALIKKWIDQGAPWLDGVGKDVSTDQHWAYGTPRRTRLPKIKKQDWPRNAIDYFVLAKQEANQLEPSPPADKAKLLRRVYLDLIGIPPSVAEMDAFLSDNSHDRYERAVDRLLASPHYGERWARPWLDAARYADSNGYQADQYREVWPYRDWVIDAMNDDMPFTQFTLEQIAGDLLPDATILQRVATGFHRQTTCNVEAGVDPEENRVNQIIDRVNTTGTVWLGTTIECVQCHDHPYDPFNQRDYYRLFAFFNNTPLEVKHTSATTYDFYGPKLDVPLEGNVTDSRRELKQKLAQTRTALDAQMDKLIANQDVWEKSVLAKWQEQKRSDGEFSSEQIVPDRIIEIIQTPAASRDEQLIDKLRKYYLEGQPDLMKLQAECAALKKQLGEAAAATTLVMLEMEQLRKTHMFSRGNFLTPTQQVTAGTPAALHAASWDDDAQLNRLSLAQWLVDEANPLTARVQVNRWWAEIFGRGIVRTVEDFGTQGEAPTHPQLLDWLAMEFMNPEPPLSQSSRITAAKPWSMKHIHRLIVTSATYQQDSRITPQHSKRDPNNVLLARAPRIRLSAELVRDNALFISGLFSAGMGGPPVYPPQPDGIWRHVGRNAPKYETDAGEDRFRRGIYVVWRRSAPYPSFVNFDAPERATCVVSRSRSNTPLQALTLLNDEAYVEMSWALARRIAAHQSDMEPKKASDRHRIKWAWRTAVGRVPSAAEASFLLNVYETELARFEADSAAATELIDTNPLPVGVRRAQLAAWFFVANILLNLDETITKG